MKCIKAALGLFVISLGLQAGPVAAGGGRVGNGAGEVEQNIIFAYEALPRAIGNCLTISVVCGLSAADQEVLSKIMAIAVAQPPSPDRVRFFPEHLSPGFFDTEVGQAHRLAKTGLTPDVPIYWNSDQLYNADGSPALAVPEITAIWIHELGHQAGLLDHAYLDELGGRVRLLMENGLPTLDYHDDGLQVSILTVNYGGTSQPSDIYLTDGTQSVLLNSYVSSRLSCPAGGEKLIGWSVEYQKWNDRAQAAPPLSLDLSYTAWLKLHCLKPGSELDEVENDLNLIFPFEKKGAAYSLDADLIH